MRTAIRWIFRALSGLALALPLLLLALAWWVIEDRPTVIQSAQINPAHIERAKRLLERNDPRRMRSGMLRTITVSQDDLDLALNYLVSRQFKGASKLSLQQDVARLSLSLPLPSNPFGHYLNIEAAVRDSGGRPQAQTLRLGRLALPQMLNDWLLRAGLAWLQRSPEYGQAADTLQQVQVSPQMLRVVYRWNEAVPDQLRAVLVRPEEQERMKAYQLRLVDLTASPRDATAPGGSGGRGGAPGSFLHTPLHSLLQPLLELARQRHDAHAIGAGGAQALALEHRALIVVLAFYVNGKGLQAVVPAAAPWPAPTPRSITLGGRGDFAQHFSISAALAATAGSPLADAVGLYKEVADSRGGSGFSFNDIAADRSGTRFGELATGGEAAQARLRKRVAAGLTDQDLLPQVKDLPEFMQEAEFRRRYGGPDSPATKRLQTDIENRIAALPLYR